MIETLNQWTGGQGPVAMGVIVIVVAFVLARLVRLLGPALERTALGPRIAKYIAVAAQGGLLTILVLVVMWIIAQRDDTTFAASLDDIGLNARLPAAETVIWSVAMIMAITLNSFTVGRVRKMFGGAPTAAGLDILPETPAETAVFSLLVSPTAGIGEEIVYRGFLLGQLWGITGNGWLAAVISSIVFGGLHIYQGWWGVLRTGVTGMILATSVVMTGSLIPAIIAHTLGNMLSAAVRKPMAPQPA